MQFPKNFFWVILILLVALVAYVIGRQGQSIDKINLSDRGFLIEFKDLKEIPKKELEVRQDNLEKKLNEFDKNLQSIRQKPLTQQPLTQANQHTFNLNGTWQSTFGTYYNINQFGNSITLQEISPIYGVTAVGQGTIYQRRINITYTTALYTRGQGILQVLDNGRQMQGEFTDLSTGTKMTAMLYR